MKKTRILLVIALIFSAKLSAQKDPSPIKEGFDQLSFMGLDSELCILDKLEFKVM